MLKKQDDGGDRDLAGHGRDELRRDVWQADVSESRRNGLQHRNLGGMLLRSVLDDLPGSL